MSLKTWTLFNSKKSQHLKKKTLNLFQMYLNRVLFLQSHNICVSYYKWSYGLVVNAHGQIFFASFVFLLFKQSHASTNNET